MYVCMYVCMYRLDYQALFGKGTRAPRPPSSWGGAKTRLEKAAEIEPIYDNVRITAV